MILTILTLVLQLAIQTPAPQDGVLLYGFPFGFLALTVPGVLQGPTAFAALSGGVSQWALYPISVVIDFGIWFLLYFAAAAFLLPLLHRK